MSAHDYFSLGALIFIARSASPQWALIFSWVCIAGQFISFFF